jgi:hypothetical protein
MRRFSLVFIFLVGVVDSLTAETQPKESVPAPEEKAVVPKVAGNLDIKNSGDGSYPVGSTPKKGTWEVDAAAKKLKVFASPLVEGWMEFGPEIREKGATMTALVRGPGEGRLQSRFGVGLYGENGFQIRAVQVSDTLQLVRRGEVLQEVVVELKPGEAYHFELSVLEDEENWGITGRVWLHETPRPKRAMISQKVVTEALLFPLAGRPVITATPFSGEPVSFLGATAYYDEYVTPDPEGKEPEKNKNVEEDQEAVEEVDGEKAAVEEE